MRKIDRPSGRVPIGGEVDGRTTPMMPRTGMPPMLAKKGARIGGIASGRAEGRMEGDFTFPKINDERGWVRSVAP